MEEDAEVFRTSHVRGVHDILLRSSFFLKLQNMKNIGLQRYYKRVRTVIRAKKYQE